MKKLIMAVTIVCATAMSHAAAFTWVTANAQKAPDIDLTNLVAGHYENNASKNLSALTGVTWTYLMTLDNGTDTDEKSGGLVIKMNKVNVENISSDVVFQPTTGKNVVDYSIVISTSYKDAAGKEWTITSDAITGTQEFESLTALKISTANATGWTVSTSAVPEPTSGLLLLLGMAGLALRRRRA